MTLQDLGLLAGSVSTVLFVVAYLPMLAKAGRTRDLTSYSPANLIIANVGNGIYSVYVFTLPVGPIWILHSFYVGSTALMLYWWWRHHGRRRRRGHPAHPARGTSRGSDVDARRVGAGATDVRSGRIR